MLINAVIYTFAPENVAAGEEALRGLRAGSRTESGCITFDVARGIDDPNVFFLYEVWSGEAALEAHYATDHFQRYGVNGVRKLAKERIGHRVRNLD
jgi:quinol monooxygenase YgiN